MDDLTFRCSDHPSSYLQFMLLKEGTYQKRLLCSECIYQSEQKFEFDDTIPIATALKQPHKMLLHTRTDQKAEYLMNVFDYCELDLCVIFMDQIKKFELFVNIWKQIKEQMVRQFQELKKIQQKLVKERETFLEKCQHNLLKQLILQLKEHDNGKSDKYISHLAKISKTIEEIKRTNFAQINQNINDIYKAQREMNINLQRPNSQQFEQQINELLKQYDKFVLKLNGIVRTRLFEATQFKILQNDYFSVLETKLEEGAKKRINQINLIYLGSRDGLKSKSFWAKVNGKKNLLMVFQSKNNGNYVFGGFSPCQWQSNLGNWVQDDSQTSFLFSQTHNQIYPLKQDQKQFAIYCHQNYGPYFGYNGNIYISSDFISGCSNLGHSYQWDQYQNKQSEHLFGGAQPNISECEIYEIIFA